MQGLSPADKGNLILEDLPSDSPHHNTDAYEDDDASPGETLQEDSEEQQEMCKTETSCFDRTLLFSIFQKYDATIAASQGISRGMRLSLGGSLTPSILDSKEEKLRNAWQSWIGKRGSQLLMGV